MEGLVAELADALVFEGLTRAAASADGLPLFARRSAPGLFAASAAGKSAAQRCKEEGLLQVVHSERKGRTAHEFCALTDKGRAFLIDHADPRHVLEALVQALQARHALLQDIGRAVQHSRDDVDTLRGVVEEVLERFAQQQAGAARWHSNGAVEPPAVPDAIRAELSRWQETGALGDCPLPELCRRLEVDHPLLTIGQFHDELRRLHDERQVYLHPWTGPLYELPEPRYALLVGHEIAYYASRNAG
jgi:hypothetical protein